MDSQIETRNLRLLVIDDRRSSLATDFPNIDPVWVRRFDEDEMIAHVEEWEQMLELLAYANSFPEFDLLAIDIKFDKDGSNLDATYSPYVSKTEAEQNPFGLVYGLVIAALTQGRPKPFAFKEYSGDGPSVKNDTVAVTACGMLLAIQRGRFWLGSKFKRPTQFVSNHLSQLENVKGPRLLRELLAGEEGYRTRLLEFASSIGGVDRIGNLEYLVDLARAREVDALREEGIVLCLSTHAEKIRLVSLFADLEKFDADSVSAVVLPYLLRLIQCFDSNHDKTFEATSTCIEFLESDGLPLNQAIVATWDRLGNDKMPTDSDLVLCVVLCTFLLSYHGHKGCIPFALRDEILEKLRVSATSQNLVDRYLKQASGELPKSLGALIKHLVRGNPLPVRYSDCCNKFWLLLGHPNLDSAPGFMRASAEDRQWRQSR